MRIPTVPSAIVYKTSAKYQGRAVSLTLFHSSLVMSSTSVLTLVKKALPSVTEYTGCTFVLPVVKLLLDKGAEINAQGGHYGNALQAASAGGHEAVVKLLLDKGADARVEAQ
jgi:hypothetical protein